MGNKIMDRDEALYELNRSCVHVVSAVDTLRELGIDKGNLKKVTKAVLVQCHKENNNFFGKNKFASEVFSRDDLLNKKMQGLSASERIAVSHFIDSLKEKS